MGIEMKEAEFALLARQYLNWLGWQNYQRPANWTQQDHLRELAHKDNLLSQMRDALANGDRT
jgi:hypothetical protein